MYLAHQALRRCKLPNLADRIVALLDGEVAGGGGGRVAGGVARVQDVRDVLRHGRPARI